MTTLTGTPAAVGEDRELQIRLFQVACHVMMVECLLIPWKQLPVLVLKLDFTVF